MKIVKVTIKHGNHYRVIVGTLENRIWGNNEEIAQIVIATDNEMVTISSADITDIVLC